MRWAELTSWAWTEDNSGLDVEPRKQLNGKYRVVMQEDVLQSMLTHYIGVSLCVNAKEELKYWLDGVMIPEAVDIITVEADRRRFYLQHRVKYNDINSLVRRLNQEFWHDFFLSQLPNSVADTGGYEDDADVKDDSGSKKSWLQVKQQLLHHVASEVLIQRKLYGDVAVVQTDLQWFATSVPHSTIFAILRFSGLPEKWLSWFRSYLEVPLNMTKTMGEDQEVKRRKRGIPMAHALEKYLGEMILVYMDVAVKREADLLLYRMHDDIVLCGPTARCEKAWASMQRFAKVMGLEYNQKKTGSVSLNKDSSIETGLPEGDVTMDFLKLSTFDGSREMDTAQVNAHVKQLKKQLDGCNDILSFIRTYNSCIGRFFGHTFGVPAQCLGHTHVKEILKTHRRMQQELFGEGGVSAVLKTKLNGLAHDRGTNLSDTLRVTDSFLYNPILLGGLGLANPFIPLLQIEPSLRDKTPAQYVDDFIEKEKSDFRTRQRAFAQESSSSKKKRRAEIFLGNNGYDEDEIDLDFDDFLTVEEYTK
ncbi:hypothetical protein LTR70_008189 [Exophiala xenobiotica]|uniref:Reverse transcriptase domain-containing protein n=1 Tax=Lithohypha guttulata TaxID=1690604 RepID=A0ABR0K1T2_9EURO|nr:hypothetical protein LTR24_007968 [Lithohypha guttulata]KAK5312419.1 hypothetical protein LTR70_008189 [Exophiala xenobiotica]